MRKNGPIVFLVATLVALFGIRGFSPDGTPPFKVEPKSGQVATSGSGNVRNAVGGESPLDEETAGPLWPALDFQNSRSNLVNAKDQEARGLDVPYWQSRYLIACVPDPQDSSSGYRFDSLIDAIQRAAEAQDFVLDRYYFPWSHKKLANASPMPALLDIGVQRALSEEWLGKLEVRFTARNKPNNELKRTDPQQWPGLLLFRAPPALLRPSVETSLCTFGLCGPRAGVWLMPVVPVSFRPQLLQVFLVGETATAGIHKQAFTASLDLIEKSQEYKDAPTIRVLGPHFSGSQISLERALQTWTMKRGKNPTFTIISGSATAIEKAKLEACCKPNQVNFQATIIPEKEVLKATLRYLGAADDGSGRFEFKFPVAILWESNTAFGAKTIPELLKSESKDENKPASFPFPRHIYEVRSAYQESSSPNKDDILKLPSFDSKLRLPLISGQPRDRPPAQDHIMAAVNTERVLGTMLDTISRERFPYAIILASDVKDTLFLASRVRQHCPDIRLVLSGNDLLLSHPDVSAALRGTIVGSSYLLYPRNQHWSTPANGIGHQHLIFPCEEAQGYYNATIALLNTAKVSESLLEYNPPFRELPKVKEFDVNRPPVWVSIVGEKGPVPLAAVPMKQNNPVADYVFSPEKAGRPEKGIEGGAFHPLYPTLWIIPVVGVTILFVYVFCAYFLALWGKPSTDGGAGGEMRKLFCPTKEGVRGAGVGRWRQRFYAFVCLASVLNLYAYLTFIWCIPFYYRLWYGEATVDVVWWKWIVPSILILLLLVIVYILLWRVLPSSWQTGIRNLSVAVRNWPYSSAGFILLLLAVIVLCIVAPEPTIGQVVIVLLLAVVVLPFLTVIVCFFEMLVSRSNVLRTWWQQMRQESPAFVVSFFVLLSILLLVVQAIYYNVAGPKAEHPWQRGDGLLFFERATSLSSGVSPVVPIFVLDMAFFCWGYVQLKRLYLLGPPHRVKNPFPRTTNLTLVNQRRKELRNVLYFPENGLKSSGAFIAWVALFFTFSRIASRFVPALEDIVTETLILFGLSALAFLILCAWLHLRGVWEHTRELLNAIALLPERLGAAFMRIPQPITDMFGPYLSTTRPGRHDQLEARLEQLNRVNSYLQNINGPNVTMPIAFGPHVTSLDQAMALPSGTAKEKSLRLCKAAQACFSLLEHIWSDPTLAEKFDEPPFTNPTEAAPDAPPLAVHVKKKIRSGSGSGSTTDIDEDIEPKFDDDKPIRNWIMRVQDFVALEAAVYLSQSFVHLRNLILFLTIAPFLMLLAVTSYPFQPQRLWLLLAVTTIVIGTATVIWIVIQVECNEVVSRILNTTPNKLNFHWDFLGHILVYAAPLLGVVVATSSVASDLVHALIDPLIQALH